MQSKLWLQNKNNCFKESRNIGFYECLMNHQTFIETYISDDRCIQGMVIWLYIVNMMKGSDELSLWNTTLSILEVSASVSHLRNKYVLYRMWSKDSVILENERCTVIEKHTPCKPSGEAWFALSILELVSWPFKCIEWSPCSIHHGC